MRSDLRAEECCYTCQYNRNNFTDDYPCNCEIEGKNNTAQDMWCEDYELADDYDVRRRGVE